MVALKDIAARFYTDRCDIYTVSDRENESHAIKKNFVLSQKNVPCMLWFSYISRSRNDRSAASVIQTMKLYLPPDTDIPEGSRVRVTHHGRFYNLGSTGTPAIYPSHIVITLERVRRWT